MPAERVGTDRVGRVADGGGGSGRWRGRWLARRTLRARLTVLATVVTALTLAAGGVLAIRVLDYVLYRTIADGARTQAEVVASLVRRGQLPNPLPAVATTAGIQVVDPAGQVLAASAGGDRLTALVPTTDFRALRAGRTLQLPGSRLGGSEPLLVVGVAADVGGRDRTVLVAVSAAELDRSSRTLANAAVLGFPVVIAGFAVICWLLTGSALRPVAALRRDAARITDAGSAQRLSLPAARDEIFALATTLNAMLDRLTAADLAQRDFIADAAHELRSPVASLRVQLEVERDHPDPRQWSATVTDLLADVGRLDRLVADLLVLARAERPAPPGRHRPVDLLDLARTVARDPALRRPGVDVVVEGPAGDGAAGGGGAGDGRPVVLGDADQLRRLLTNVAANAVAFASRRVEIDVAAPASPATPGAPSAPATDRTAGTAGGVLVRTVRLSISDDGPGIPADDRNRVFDRFTRLDPDRPRAHGGAGLGLAIVARLVAAHSGTITLADARPGATPPGLRVTIELPAPEAPPAGGPRGARHPGRR